MEPTEADWIRVGIAIADRMAFLVIGPADIKKRGGPSDKMLKGYLSGAPIIKKDVKRRLCTALEWTHDSIDRILRNEQPIAFASIQGSPDPAKDGHDGTDGWPAWLENWLKSEIGSVRQALGAILERVEALEAQEQNPPA